MIFELCVYSVVSLVSLWILMGYSVIGLLLISNQLRLISLVMPQGSQVRRLPLKPKLIRLIRLPIYYGSFCKPISYMNSYCRLCILNNHCGSLCNGLPPMDKYFSLSLPIDYGRTVRLLFCSSNVLRLLRSPIAFGSSVNPLLNRLSVCLLVRLLHSSTPAAFMNYFFNIY